MTLWVTMVGLAAAAPQPIDAASLEAFEVPDAAVPPPDEWWSSLGDDGLNEVLTRAFDGNQELAVSAAGVQQASGTALATGSALLPSASFDVTATGQPLDNVAFCAVGQPDFLNQPDADWCWQGSARLNARWNLDVFGRSTTGYLASRYDAEAARGNRDAVELQVASRVANAYFDVVAARQQLEIVQTQLATQNDLASLVEFRYEQGLATSLDVLQQRSAVSGTEALQPPARLSLQVGTRPAVGTSVVSPDVAAASAAAMAAGKPATMLGSRKASPVTVRRRGRMSIRVFLVLVWNSNVSLPL